MKCQTLGFGLSPQRPLHSDMLFWLLILVPIFIGAAMILTTLPFCCSFSWSAEGFNLFLELAKLPLYIAGLSLPLGTIYAVMHRSAQTSEQIKLSIELSKFNDFKEHRNAIIDEIKLNLSKGLEGVDIKCMYKVIFPDIIQRKYKPKFPDSWYELYGFMSDESSLEQNSIFRLEMKLGSLDDKEINDIIELKCGVIRKIASLLDRAVTVLNPDFWFDDIFGRNGIHDDDDFFFKRDKLASDCRNMLRKINAISKSILDSSVYHFMTKKQIDMLEYFSMVEIVFENDPESLLENPLFPEWSDVIRRLLHDDGHGNMENGDLVAITFGIHENTF